MKIQPKGTKVIGPYSPAVISGNLMFVSGQIGVNTDIELVSQDVSEQTKQALSNLKDILTAGGSSIEDVLKCTVFLSDINDYSSVNKVYADFFGNHAPARAAVEVSALPKGAKVEIECVAAVSGQ